MRILVTGPSILLAGLALSGCATSTGPVGVLPRDPVPPPPSVSAEPPQRAGSQGAGPSAQRRALSVPSQAVSRRP